jgi:hypothetical protein
MMIHLGKIKAKLWGTSGKSVVLKAVPERSSKMRPLFQDPDQIVIYRGMRGKGLI